MMNKNEKQRFLEMEAELQKGKAERAKLEEYNRQMRQEWLRKETRRKRRKGGEDTPTSVLLRQFEELYFNDFRETKLAILQHEGLPETYRKTLTSKIVERQIFNNGKVTLFKKYIKFPTANKTQLRTEEVPLLLPFTGAEGYITPYGDFFVIRPYFGNGGGGLQNPLDNLTVNEDCVVFTDFFEYSPTNANKSLCMQAVTRLYAKILAEIEVAKIQNRNFIKIPFIVDASEITDNNEMREMIEEIRAIVEGSERHANAILTKYARNIRIINTGVQYYGNEFEQAKKDAVNALYNYFGIGNIKNENRARKITAEMEHTQDEYNINITKVLQNRTESWKEAARLWPEFSDVTVKVNLTAYNAAQEYLQQLTEGGTEAQEEFEDRTNREMS